MDVKCFDSLYHITGINRNFIFIIFLIQGINPVSVVHLLNTG